jgi:Tfp pilus assembly PilM family ATPase
VPFTKDEQIRKVVGYTAEEYFPAFSMDEVVLEYLKVGELGGKSLLLVAALRNSVIESRLALLKRAELDPVALDLDAAALFNAFAITPPYAETRATLLIDMGATSRERLRVPVASLALGRRRFMKEVSYWELKIILNCFR